MIIIVISPGNKSIHQLRYYIATTVQHDRVREGTQKPDTYVLPSSPRDDGDVLFFIFDFGCQNPKVYMNRVSKKTDIKLRNGRPQRV